VHKPRYRTLACALCFAVTVTRVAPLSAGESSTQPLTSAAIDPTIYRDGEVRRFASTHAAWHVVCDEIARLKQRFCSLRTPILGADGTPAAELTISTGQDGRPAALLRMAAKLIENATLEISEPPERQVPGTRPQKPKAKPSSKPPSANKVKPVSCDPNVCTIIWTLRPAQIEALNDGRGLKLTTNPANPTPGLAALQPAKPISQPSTVSFIVDAEGFTAAVAVSTQPFDEPPKPTP